MFTLLLLLFATNPPEWPQLRGPQSDGVVKDDPRLPVRWSQTENILWKADVPGMGWSSPVVAGKHVFITAVVRSEAQDLPQKGLYGGRMSSKPGDEHRWLVLAYDLQSGRKIWERDVHHGQPGVARHVKNSYASETPVTDGERVYAYFGSAGLFCLDFDGKLIWQQKITPRETRYGWGTAASPLVHANRVYIVSDSEDGSFIAAFDKKNGKEIWLRTRDEKSNWATPYVWQHTRTEIVVPGTNRVRSYDLDGNVLWEFGGMSSITIPMPFSRHGMLYVSSGYVGDQTRPVFAIKPGARGDISLKAGETSNEWIAWHLPQAGSYNPSPLIHGDNYYTLFDRGFFTAHDARSGREIYSRQRIDPTAAAFTASPWAYNNRIFALSEDGDTYVIEAGPAFRVLGKNSLDEMTLATPAIAQGSLIIRTATKLYRIGTKP